MLCPAEWKREHSFYDSFMSCQEAVPHVATGHGAVALEALPARPFDDWRAGSLSLGSNGVAHCFDNLFTSPTN